jgi:hypothetical protein
VLGRLVASTISIVLACCTLALLAASSAVAAPTWLAPVPLSGVSSGSGLDAHVAVDSEGNVVAIWSRHIGSDSAIVEGAVRPAGGDGWQAPVPLSAEGGTADQPVLAVDSRGDAIAVWERYIGGRWTIEATVRPAGSGVWQPPVQLSGEGQTAHSPQIAINPQGDAVVVWMRDIGSLNTVIEGSFKPSGSETWQAPAALSAEGELAEAPYVASDAQGDAVAVWQRQGATRIVEGAVRPAATGIWRAPVAISEGGGNAFVGSVAVDPQGDAIAVWDRENGSHRVVEAALGTATSGSWQTPIALSAAGEDADEPHVAFDSKGNAVAVWQSSNGTDEAIEAVARPAASGVWQMPVVIARGLLTGEFLEVAVDAMGNAVAVWDHSNGGDYIVEATDRSAANGVWQTPTPLSAADKSSYIPQAAIDPWGHERHTRLRRRGQLRSDSNWRRCSR